MLAPEAAVLELGYAEGIGRAVGRLLNRLHHRVDVKIDQGLQLLTCDFDRIDFHDSYLDETMPKEPTHKWLLDYARLSLAGDFTSADVLEWPEAS